MSYREIYNEWLSNPYFDEAAKAELKSIADDEKEIEDRFYTELEFGTAGLRGVIGAGTNRMNIYTVRKATQGLANYIKLVGKEDKGVAIAYDSRNMSKKQARRRRALQLLMTPEECRRNLLMRQLFVWRQTESKHMYLSLCGPRQNCPMQSAD